MRKCTILMFSLFALALSSVSHASDHGWVMGLQKADRANNVFRVNISWVDGHTSNPGVEKRVKPGKHEVTVNLVQEPLWTEKMTAARNYTYSKTFTLEVEAGKTYVIGGVVDPDASREAQEDGSFWYPVIVDTKSN